MERYQGNELEEGDRDNGMREGKIKRWDERNGDKEKE